MNTWTELVLALLIVCVIIVGLFVALRMHHKRESDHITSQTLGITVDDARELRERAEIEQDWHDMQDPINQPKRKRKGGA
jgi:signal transduction histidine kinase